MRIVVVGAGGRTGRLLVERAVAAGHDVTAVVRREAGETGTGPARRVVADARDLAALTRVLGGRDAVLSGLGAQPSLRPVDLYSRTTATLIEAMRRASVTRLVAVTSSVLDPRWRPTGEHLFNLVVDPLVNRPLTRTVHRDMHRAEEQLRASGLDWTTARPSGLFDHPRVTDYVVAPDRADGLWTARVDLAAAMVDELERPRHVGRPMAVITTQVRPGVVGLVRQELAARRR